MKLTDIVLGVMIGSLVAIVGSRYSGKPTTTDVMISPISSYKSEGTKPEVKAENLKKKSDYLELKGGGRVLTLFGPIGENATVVAQEIVKMGKTPEPIYLILDSPGGSVFHGAQVVAAMRGVTAPVITVVVMECASMCAVIHQYGHERLMVDNSFLMFHSASGGTQGELEAMHNELEFISKYVYRFDSFIAARAGMEYAQFKHIQAKQLWMDAEDAVERKFADKLVTLSLESSPMDVLMQQRRERAEKGRLRF